MHGLSLSSFLLCVFAGVVSVCTALAVLTESIGLSLELGALAAGFMVTSSRDVRRAMQAMEPLSKVSLQ